MDYHLKSNGIFDRKRFGDNQNSLGGLALADIEMVCDFFVSQILLRITLRMIYFLHIAYDGSKYRGWQRQPTAHTVQEELEMHLKEVFKEKVTAFGCGRTDAQVHASQYFVHIKRDEPIDFDLKFRLTMKLPTDIVVYDVLPMEDNCHARYDAVSRTYDYFIHLFNDPFLANYSSWYALENLDFEAMKLAVALLPGKKDFMAVCKNPVSHKHTICHVKSTEFTVSEDETRLRFRITADRFLQGMVRLCVGFLLEVGRGRLPVSAFESILEKKELLPNLRPATPNGLYLSKVEYPYLSLESKKGHREFPTRALG